jgi:hypothetical protein
MLVAMLRLSGGILIVLGIDLHAGIPLLWTVVEGPSIAALGVVTAVLNRRECPSLR